MWITILCTILLTLSCNSEIKEEVWIVSGIRENPVKSWLTSEYQVAFTNGEQRGASWALANTIEVGDRFIVRSRAGQVISAEKYEKGKYEKGK